MTQFSFTDDYDEYGQPRRQTAVAMPRLVKHQYSVTGAATGAFNPNETHVLATCTTTEYAVPQSPEVYIHNRTAQTKNYELLNPPPGPDSATDDLQLALIKQRDLARQVHTLFADRSGGDVRLISHQLEHYDGPEFTGLPVGQVGKHGALIRSETLVFTGELLDQIYADRCPAYLNGTASLPTEAPINFGTDSGYRKKDATAGSHENGYYIDSLRQALSSRGLPIALQDALGHETTISYDVHELLPKTVTDPVGLETKAQYNYRLLQPQNMTEPNGNTTHVLYNPIGLPHKQYLVGRDAQGNETLGGTADQPEIIYAYNFFNVEQSGQPVFVHTSRRVHHAGENRSDETIQSREYSDGFGRLIQQRAQAENLVFGKMGHEVGLPEKPGSTPKTAAGQRSKETVVVSGWQVFDNKGQVIEKYEEFLDNDWEFQPETDARTGEHVSLFYDPLGRVIRTLNPDGSQQRVIFGRPITAEELALTRNDLESTDVPDTFAPSPWESFSYDANDLAELTHPNSDAVPDEHHYTPASTILDALGRTCCAVARNGGKTEDWIITRSRYDIRSNLITVIDALGREAFKYSYDLHNRPLQVDSIDAGRRTSVFNALGDLIEYRDDKGSLVLRTYDALNRPKEVWARDNSTGKCTLRERILYGDEGDRATARQLNSLGRPVQHFDEAGVLKMLSYDFKGNLMEKSRLTIQDSSLADDWQADWSADDAKDTLEPSAFLTSMSFDALNRPAEIIYPEDVDGERKKLIPRYNRAGALQAVLLNDEDYVQQISYNAKGQRVLICYGNGLMTRYAYDPKTFRLIRMRTEQFNHQADPASGTESWQGSGQIIQDFSYGYDQVGNITRIDEHTPGCGMTRSPLGPDHLLREFTYDPIYRLLSATGRACTNNAVPRNLADDPTCGFFAGNSQAANQNNAPDLTEQYTERFSYDPAGNMLELAYHADSGSWTRRFALGGLPEDQWQAAPNNRLTGLRSGDTRNSFDFDANGNMLRQNTSKHHIWDHADRMIGYRVQAKENGPVSVQVRYLYGADGMRVKKWVRNQQGQVNTSTYIDGIFEQHRLVNANEDKTNNTLHVMDDQSRIALVRVGQPLDARDASPQVQYHFGDHLGSSHVVVGGDTAGANSFINREEYFPYGETSFGCFGRKRYRYSGKERDEESGLYYYGARYLAPWLGRWLNCDPVGPIDHINLFLFSALNPIRYKDKIGHTSRPAEDAANLAVQRVDARYSGESKEVGSNHRRSVTDEQIEAMNKGNTLRASDGTYPTNCTEFPIDTLEAYFNSKRQHAVFREIIASARDSRGYYLGDITSGVQSARGTYLIRLLREKAGFKVAYFTFNEADSPKSKLYPPKVKNVIGADTGKTIKHVNTHIDREYIASGDNNKENRNDLLSLIKNTTFAIGTVDYGHHMFVIAYGEVFEVHYDEGKTSLNLYEVSDFENFASKFDHGVIAFPPEQSLNISPLISNSQ